MNDLDKYAQQLSLFGEMPTVPHPKGFREELHAREKDSIPNPNRHPGQFAPKGGSNPLLKVVEHANGWAASAMLKDGKEFRVEGRDRREAISNAIRAGERMGVIFDPPKAEPALGGLFDENAHPRHKAGNSDGGQFAPKNEVASSESKSQPDPLAIAQEALSNNENIGITMGRHGVTIKGHPDYRTIRQQVSKHLEELQEQAKPKPSPARQRAIDAQIRNRAENPADNYSHRAYEQLEEEAERYFRDYTLYDVDRYGMGGGIMKLILSMMAMHAMSSIINKQSQARQQSPTQKPSPTAPTTPSNQDFEKLHPRAQTQSGNSKPGQFAKKPEGQKQHSPPPQPREARPLTELPDKKTQLSQSPPTQQQPTPVTPKPWLAEPGSPKPDVTAYDLDPRRGTPEQKAGAMQSRMDRDAGAHQQPAQTPADPNTARIAEIWHGKGSGEADDFGAGVDLAPKSIKTVAGPNPRKKTLEDGSVNPHYKPQQLFTQKKTTPSLLDSSVTDSGNNNDIFANPAAKARKEKAELDRITKFDPTEFGDGIEQPDAPMARPTIQSTQGDYTALEATRDERAKQVKAFRDWEKKTQEDPETNIADVATEHDLDHEPFSNYAKEMQAFEESEWKRREAVKTAIRKTWGVDGSDLRTMENRYQDHSVLSRGDELKGNLDDSDIYEFLGSDEQEWAPNAWAMLREEQPERPGAHSKDWLRSHAENFKRLQAMTQPETDLYPEPEDGMPFSKKAIVKEIDRYFRQHLSRIRSTKVNSDSLSWTVLDTWL